MKKAIILVIFLIITISNLEADKPFSLSTIDDEITSLNGTIPKLSDGMNSFEIAQQPTIVTEGQHKRTITPKSKVPQKQIRWSNPAIGTKTGSTDSIPREAIKRTSFDIKLGPGKSSYFNVPLQNGGTLVTVRFVPHEKGKKEQKPTIKPIKKRVRPLAPGDLEREINKLIQEQQKERGKKILSFTFYVGKENFLPIDGLSSQYKFLIRAGKEYSKYKTGKGILKNLENSSLAGKVFVSSIDITKKEKFERERRNKNIQDAIEKFRNPDMLWVLNHTLKRHLRGYPGGKSEFEKDFAKNLARLRVSKNVIRKISGSLQPLEPRIAQSVKDKSLIKLPLRQPVKKKMIRPILKIKSVKVEPKMFKPGDAVFGEELRGNSYIFESSPYISRYIQHEAIRSGRESVGLYTWELTTASERKRSTFKVISGLADSRYFSFESLDNPGYYINTKKPSKYGLNLFLSKESLDLEFKKHATFKIVPALTGDPFPSISIESYYYPGKFIYDIGPGGMFGHVLQIGSLSENAGINDEEFKKGATFVAHKVAQEGKHEKYKIRLLGIMSHRCADDEGWELGCDSEEPYIVWTCFGPMYDAFGRTDTGRGVNKNDFYFYSEDVNVFGAGQNRDLSTFVHAPLFYLFMVIEKDSGSPSREEVIGVVKTAVSTVESAFEGDWKEMAESGSGFIYDAVRVFQKISAKGDDEYPPFIIKYDEESLLSLTSGSSSLPSLLEIELVRSVGNYDHESIRRVKVYKDPFNRRKLQWSVYYIILRSE